MISLIAVLLLALIAVGTFFDGAVRLWPLCRRFLTLDMCISNASAGVVDVYEGGTLLRL